MEAHIQRGAAPVHLPSVSYWIWAVKPDGEEENTVTIEEGSNFRTLLRAADRQFENVPPGNSPLISSGEMLYDREGEQRRAMACFDKNTEDYIYIDLEDSRPVDSTSRLRISRRFLQPSAPLPISGDKNFPPAIVIFTEHKFLTVAAGKLQTATPNDFTDSKFVAALLGVQSGGQLFWGVDRGDLVCAETGEVFDRKDIPGEPKCHVMLLLRDEDQVPRCKIPDDRELWVLWRTNVKLGVQNGRLRCDGSPQPEHLDLWTYYVKDDDFSAKFTRAASGSSAGRS